MDHERELHNLGLAVAELAVSCLIGGVTGANTAGLAPMARIAASLGLSFARSKELQVRLESIALSVAQDFGGILEGENVPVDHRGVMVSQLRRLLSKSSIDLDFVVMRHDLQPGRMAEAIVQAHKLELATLTEEEEGLLRRMLGLAFAYIVRSISTHPGFVVKGAERLFERLIDIQLAVDELREEQGRIRRLSMRSDQLASSAIAAFRRICVDSLNRPDSFGLAQLSQTSTRYPVDVAFVDLPCRVDIIVARAEHDDEGVAAEGPKAIGEGRNDQHSSPTDAYSSGLGASSGVEPVAQTSQDAAELGYRALRRLRSLLDEPRRLLIRGPAGSGKTTFLRWLAVQAASGRFTGTLRYWNERVPFLVRLRDFDGRQLLPDVKHLPKATVQYPPAFPDGLVDELFDAGRALLLVDGVDEIGPDRRDDLGQWITGLLHRFPLTPTIVTGRPTAVCEGWLSSMDFEDIELLPMTPVDVESFVRHWHSAVATVSPVERPRLESLREGLLRQLREDAALRELAANPLLCATMCGLQRDMETVSLPASRIDLYQRFVDMLLGERDSARGIRTPKALSDVSRLHKELVAREVAHWMAINAATDSRTPVSSIPRDSAAAAANRTLSGFVHVPEEQGTAVVDDLVERSGLLRHVGSDSLEFAHRSLGEYLAASHFVARGDSEYIMHRVTNDSWHDIIAYSVGLANRFNQQMRDRLLERVINQAQSGTRAVGLMALSVLEHQGLQLSQGLSAEYAKLLSRLRCPKSSYEAVRFSYAGSLAEAQLVFNSGMSSNEIRYAVEALCRMRSEGSVRILKTYSEYKPVMHGFSSDPVIDSIVLTVLDAATPSRVRSRLLSDVLSGFTISSLMISNSTTDDLSPLGELCGLEYIVLSRLPQVKDVSVLSRFRLKGVYIEHVPNLVNLQFFNDMPSLHYRGY